MLFRRFLDLLVDQRFPWLFYKQLFIKNKLNNEASKKIRVAITFDVEQDNNSEAKKSLTKAKSFLEIISEILKAKPATFFIQGDLVAELGKELAFLQKKHELGLHGFSHNRLWGKPVWFLKDKPLNKKEKEIFIKKSLENFSRARLSKPQSFRAPNMVIDGETIKILNKYGFKVDSSFSSFRNFSLPFIKEGVLEIPVSNLFQPRIRFIKLVPVLDFQVLNIENLKRSIKKNWQENIWQMVKFSQHNFLVFLAHSWDFNKQVFQNFIDFLEDNWQVRYLTIQELAGELLKKIHE